MTSYLNSSLKAQSAFPINYRTEAMFYIYSLSLCKNNFYIEVQLIYNAVLVSGIQQSHSVIHIYLHSFSDSFPIQVIIEYRVEFSMLYSRSLLIIYFMYRQIDIVQIDIVLVAQSYLTLQHHGLQPTRLLCPWNSPGKNTGLGSHSLLQGNLPHSGWSLGLLHCRQILYCVSCQGSPYFIYGSVYVIQLTL